MPIKVRDNPFIYLFNVLLNRCPRCRKGKLFISSNAYNFKNNTKMVDRCKTCNQPTEIEVGFYYGTGYVSYALTVAFYGISCFLWWLLFGLSLMDNSILWWFGSVTVALLASQPLIMRLSRSLWLSWFVPYDPNWQSNPLVEPERIVPEQMNNW